MKYDSRLKGIVKSASKDESRYSIKVIQIDADLKVAVATNGHVLTIIDIKDLLAEGEGSFMIPPEVIIEAEKRKRKTDSAIEIVLRDGKVVLRAWESDVQLWDAPKVQFPNWQLVVGQPDQYQHVATLNAKLLLDVAQGLQGEAGEPIVSLWMKDANSSLMVSSGPESLGVIMPSEGEHKIEKFWVTSNGEVQVYRRVHFDV